MLAAHTNKGEGLRGGGCPRVELFLLHCCLLLTSDHRVNTLTRHRVC
jgi:hypothetical protein